MLNKDKILHECKECEYQFDVTKEVNTDTARWNSKECPKCGKLNLLGRIYKFDHEPFIRYLPHFVSD